MPPSSPLLRRRAKGPSSPVTASPAMVMASRIAEVDTRPDKAPVELEAVVTMIGLVVGGVMKRKTIVLAFALSLALAACNGGGDSGQANQGGEVTSASSTPLSSSTTSNTATQPAGADNPDTPCRPGESRSSAAGEPLGDVDGDGQVDKVYLSEGSIGVETSTGVVSEVETASARPVKVIGVADANEDGRGEIFILTSGTSDSQLVSLVRIAVLTDCQVTFLNNSSGDPYSFEVGKSDAGGSGVGCVDADGDGRLELVGLSFDRSGSNVSWRRTIVEIDGTRATNGPVDEGTFVSPQDDAQIALLGDVTCGDNPLTAELGA